MERPIRKESLLIGQDRSWLQGTLVGSQQREQTACLAEGRQSERPASAWGEQRSRVGLRLTVCPWALLSGQTQDCQEADVSEAHPPRLPMQWTGAPQGTETQSSVQELLEERVSWPINADLVQTSEAKETMA